MIHKLLARQLKLLSLEQGSLPAEISKWQDFLERVNKVYLDCDQERYLLERALNISSKEMQERWQALDLEKAKTAHSAKFATLGEMAGGIAHEINNPIGLISILASQLIEQREDNSLSEETLVDALKQIEASAWRVAKIIKSLRDFSRDGSKDSFLEVPIKKIIEDVLIFCSEKFKQHNVTLRIIDLEPNMKAECREVEVCQALLNLLNNSLDAVQKFDNKWIELKVAESDNYVEFSVTDCGNKIPDEVVKKLFQPFFTTKEIGKGTGIGLSISKKIAENHGGLLSYDSSSSNTRFILKIAKRQKSAPSASAA
ncbi:MAG: sensor histidine kinase [Bdellovibrionales bacterium]